MMPKLNSIHPVATGRPAIARFRMAVLAAAAAGAAACGGGGGDSGTTAPASDSGGSTTVGTIVEPKVFSNPSDSRMMSYKASTGEQVTIHGRRDAGGKPIALSQIDVTDTDGKTYEIVLDRYGQPNAIRDETGLAVSLDLSGNAAVAAQGPTPKEFLPSTLESIPAEVSAPTSTGGVYQVNTQLSLDAPIVTSLDQALADLGAPDVVGNLDVRVEKCGEPANAAGPVTVSYKHPTGQLKHYVRAEATGTVGLYRAQIPLRSANPTAPATLRAWCSSVATQLSRFCYVLGEFEDKNPGASVAACAQLGATVGTLALPTEGLVPLIPGEPVAFGAAATGLCNGVFKFGNLACKTVGFGPGHTFVNPDIPPTVLGELCETNILDAVDSAAGLDTYEIQAVADFRSVPQFVAAGSTSTAGRAVTPVGNVSSSGPLPTMSLNFNEPTIDLLQTTPGNPDPKQGYEARAEFSCAAGANLSMTVTGTDGYSALVDKLGINDKEVLIKQVPGGAQNVKDTITAYGNNPATGEVRKTLSIVF